MNRLRLIAITDLGRWPGEHVVERFERIARSALPGSVAVQLRGPFASDREALALGQRLRELARRADQRFVVNDRLDFALLLAADGVHLGERSVETRDARQLLGKGWISRACHDPAEVAQIDADAVLLSPIVEARKGRAALGVEGLQRVASGTGEGTKKIFALGGVGAESARACLAAGADGVAVVEAAWGAEPEALLSALGVTAVSR